MADGDIAGAGRRYDDGVRALGRGGSKLSPPAESLRRAVTDLLAAAELRPELAPTWTVLATSLADDDGAPIREHLSALGQAGHLHDVLAQVRSAAPDLWPYVTPHIPAGWSPPRREVQGNARWVIAGGLIVGVLVFLGIAAALLPSSEPVPRGFSPEAAAARSACATATGEDHRACARIADLQAALDAGDCAAAASILDELSGDGGRASYAGWVWGSVRLSEVCGE